MKQAIQDDRIVRKLTQKKGAWSTIAESIAQGHSGSLVTADNWVFGYFEDGLIAIEASDPLEAAALQLDIGKHIGGPLTFGLAEPSWPTEH